MVGVGGWVVVVEVEVEVEVEVDVEVDDVELLDDEELDDEELDEDEELEEDELDELEELEDDELPGVVVLVGGTPSPAHVVPFKANTGTDLGPASLAPYPNLTMPLVGRLAVQNSGVAVTLVPLWTMDAL